MVNDYLLGDAEWMGQVHRFLGLSVGLIQQTCDRRNGVAITTATSPMPLTRSWLITCDNMAADISRWFSGSFSTGLMRLINSLMKPALLIFPARLSAPRRRTQAAHVVTERAAELGRDGIDPEGDYEVDEQRQPSRMRASPKE